MATPEKLNPVIEQIPESPELPEVLENQTGIKAIETAVTANIKDNSGNPMIQTPQNQKVKIEIPYTIEQIKELSRGSIIDAITWRAIYYFRQLKKMMKLEKEVSNAA